MQGSKDVDDTFVKAAIALIASVAFVTSVMLVVDRQIITSSEMSVLRS